MNKRIKIILVLTGLTGLTVFLVLFFIPSRTKTVRLATTTSVQDSGLLEVLLPVFETRSKIKIQVIAVGTGASLKLGENGDVELVLTHAPDLEEKFLQKGFGLDHRRVMFNDFVVSGPREDPAGLREKKEVDEVLRTLARNKYIFVSRGDNSGTHYKEKEIWKKIGVIPQGKWYLETGQGMGPTLLVANEKKGYCLVDRATFLNYQDKIKLVLLYQGDPQLKNFYSIMAVNPKRYPRLKYRTAKLFIDWLVSAEAREIIRNFRKNGQVLFTPIPLSSPFIKGGNRGI